MIAKLEQQGKKIFQWGEELVDITTLENLVYSNVSRIISPHHNKSAQPPS